MNIEILEFAEGARKARGIAVIIDVFRAFSVACYAYDAGAARIIATDSVENALSLKSKYRNSVLIGERNERKIEGFDFGNSPTEILKNDLTGVTVIHTTTAGTMGLSNTTGAETVLAASIVNASSTASYISAKHPDTVSLVAMGYRAIFPAEEDLLCARMIKARLLGQNDDWDRQISELKDGAGKRFFDAANIEFSPPTDFFLCTMADRFDFVLKAERRFDGNIDLSRVDFKD
jgi:2-phosphosulfolactate phosphatase